MATRLAGELELDARFVRSDLYDLPNVLEGEFDLVYTSRGVLGWLPDISRWARVVSHFLKPGGTFYITEIHPVAQAFENEGVAPGELRLQYPYWEHPEPLAFVVEGSYADRSATVSTHTEYGWDHGLGEIVTALIEAVCASSRCASSRGSPGSSTSWHKTAITHGACHRTSPASCRSPSLYWP